MKEHNLLSTPSPQYYCSFIPVLSSTFYYNRHYVLRNTRESDFCNSLLLVDEQTLMVCDDAVRYVICFAICSNPTGDHIQLLKFDLNYCGKNISQVICQFIRACGCCSVINIKTKALFNSLPLCFFAALVMTAVGSFGDSQDTKSVSTFQ